MSNEHESKLKAMAEAEARCATKAQDTRESMHGLSQGQCASPSLRERIASQRYRAQAEARQSEALMELEFLMDKHPEVARILELLERVRG